MVITRKRRTGPSLSFTDDGPSTSKAICHSCYERGITSYTVPYIMKDGRLDKGFRQCPYCNDIIPVKLTRMESNTQPLGYVGGMGPVSFEIIQRRRRLRHNRDSEDVFVVNDYPLAGHIDSDLVYLANEGIIVSVNDSGNDAEEEQ